MSLRVAHIVLDGTNHSVFLIPNEVPVGGELGFIKQRAGKKKGIKIISIGDVIEEDTDDTKSLTLGGELLTSTPEVALVLTNLLNVAFLLGKMHGRNPPPKLKLSQKAASN